MSRWQTNPGKSGVRRMRWACVDLFTKKTAQNTLCPWINRVVEAKQVPGDSDIMQNSHEMKNANEKHQKSHGVACRMEKGTGTGLLEKLDPDK